MVVCVLLGSLFLIMPLDPGHQVPEVAEVNFHAKGRAVAL
jgi:hypothetical protein